MSWTMSLVPVVLGAHEALAEIHTKSEVIHVRGCIDSVYCKILVLGTRPLRPRILCKRDLQHTARRRSWNSGPRHVFSRGGAGKLAPTTQ